MKHHELLPIDRDSLREHDPHPIQDAIWNRLDSNLDALPKRKYPILKGMGVVAVFVAGLVIGRLGVVEQHVAMPNILQDNDRAEVLPSEKAESPILPREDHSSQEAVGRSSLRQTSPKHPTVSVPSAAPITPIEQPVAQPGKPNWLALYNNGDMAAALKSVLQEPGGIFGVVEASNSPAELLILSDLARMNGGNTQAAIVALNRIIDLHPTDPSAQVAAFTLGNMYEKSDPIMARFYHQKARNLNGALAEDALCKEIRAELRNNRDDAILKAKEYMAKYPDGPCKEDAQRAIAGDTDMENEPLSDTASTH